MKREQPRDSFHRPAVSVAIGLAALTLGNANPVSAKTTAPEARAASIERTYGIKPQKTVRGALLAVKRQLRTAGRLRVAPIEGDVLLKTSGATTDEVQSCRIPRPITVAMDESVSQKDSYLFAVKPDPSPTKKPATGDVTTAGGVKVRVVPLGERSEQTDLHQIPTPDDFIPRTNGMNTLTGPVDVYEVGGQLRGGLAGYQGDTVSTLPAAIISYCRPVPETRLGT